MSTFSSPADTSRWTALNCIIPATKSIILVAGNRGFNIQSFEQFKTGMKTSKNIDINPSPAPVDQLLIIDNRDVLRFAKVDESIHLHCQAGPYAHVFKNIVDQIVTKENDMLDQIQQLSTLYSANHHEINRQNRNVLDFFLGKSTGKIISQHQLAFIFFVIIQARMTFSTCVGVWYLNTHHPTLPPPPPSRSSPGQYGQSNDKRKITPYILGYNARLETSI